MSLQMEHLSVGWWQEIKITAYKIAVREICSALSGRLKQEKLLLSL